MKGKCSKSMSLLECGMRGANKWMAQLIPIDEVGEPCGERGGSPTLTDSFPYFIE